MSLLAQLALQLPEEVDSAPLLTRDDGVDKFVVQQTFRQIAIERAVVVLKDDVRHVSVGVVPIRRNKVEHFMTTV